MRVQAIVGLLGAMLAGCTADAYSSFPSSMRANAPPVSAPEQTPPVGAIVRDQLASIFLSSALPHNVQVSPAHRDPRLDRLREGGSYVCERAGNANSRVPHNHR
jgi:hypothetical protein